MADTPSSPEHQEYAHDRRKLLTDLRSQLNLPTFTPQKRMQALESPQYKGRQGKLLAEAVIREGLPLIVDLVLHDHPLLVADLSEQDIRTELANAGDFDIAERNSQSRRKGHSLSDSAIWHIQQFQRNILQPVSPDHDPARRR